MRKPILLTDGRYVFVHTEAGVMGPFNYSDDAEAVRRDPYGCPFNPEGCVGGVVHRVENPMFVPPEIRVMGDEEGGDAN